MGIGGVLSDEVDVHVVDIPSPHWGEVGGEIELEVGLIAAFPRQGT